MWPGAGATGQWEGTAKGRKGTFRATATSVPRPCGICQSAKSSTFEIGKFYRV